MIWASSSRTVETCSFWSGERMVDALAMFVKLSESVASMIAPANARPNDSPNEPPAEFTPAASLTCSSSIGESV